MNHAMITQLATARQADLRSDATSRPHRAARPGPATRPAAPGRLRQRLGYTLVETGLYLLAAPAPRP